MASFWADLIEFVLNRRKGARERERKAHEFWAPPPKPPRKKQPHEEFQDFFRDRHGEKW